MAFHLEIVTPEKKVFSGKVKKLIIPSITGQLTILTKHIPLFTPLSKGEVKVIKADDKVKKVPIGKGMIEVKEEKVILLVESPEQAEKVVRQKAKEAEKKAREFDRKKIEPKGKIAPEDAFRRSLIDLKGLKLKKGKKFQPLSPSLSAKTE